MDRLRRRGGEGRRQHDAQGGRREGPGASVYLCQQYLYNNSSYILFKHNICIATCNKSNYLSIKAVLAAPSSASDLEAAVTRGVSAIEGVGAVTSGIYYIHI